MNSGAVGAALCCLLKQMNMTSSCRLSLQTNTKSVVTEPRLCVGGAPLLPSLKSPTNEWLSFSVSQASTIVRERNRKCRKRKTVVLLVLSHYKCISRRALFQRKISVSHYYIILQSLQNCKIFLPSNSEDQKDTILSVTAIIQKLSFVVGIQKSVIAGKMSLLVPFNNCLLTYGNQVAVTLNLTSFHFSAEFP